MEGAVGGADAASQAAEALEKEIEWKINKNRQTYKQTENQSVLQVNCI
jgi:hypothetical protein